MIFKSYNRANLTTPPLRTSTRRAQNAQDERLGPPWSHALTRKRFHFFQAARTQPGAELIAPISAHHNRPTRAHTAPGAAPHTQLASPGPEGPVPSRVGPPRAPRGGPEAGSARRARWPLAWARTGRRTSGPSKRAHRARTRARGPPAHTLRPARAGDPERHAFLRAHRSLRLLRRATGRPAAITCRRAPLRCPPAPRLPCRHRGGSAHTPSGRCRSPRPSAPE